ncbi:glycoside hydrolase family 9 protein [Amphiplicatus metriothermophilus]|uniref:Endoglucanase n=1 Tax=Amphiplicatus metriothermophilus TaxID=1519374 RepID=A0A239PWE5_9PROT|nr:glycoside hydrolase family 9 protein [Amphiplicatus metriothermophilus]MBB5518975.1 endoglucanase [Amphiplicatus metriothermophilus]SNT74575.1 cellulose 1,4-beta-cellobiosidase [Amphiplicatus metriothermophilus]
MSHSIRVAAAALLAGSLSAAAAASEKTPGERAAVEAIHLNQHGFAPDAEKRATVVSDSKRALAWRLVDQNGESVAQGETAPFGYSRNAGHSVHIADFSGVAAEGEGYRLAVGSAQSAPFAISTRIYRPLKFDALAFFYHQRSGIEISADLVGAEWARPAAHAPDLATCYGPKDFRGNDWGGCPYTLDVSKGWYDAGDHGKYVVNGGIAVWTLLNYFERAYGRDPARFAFGDGALAVPEAGNGVPDLLDEARWQLDFMLAMQVPDGAALKLPRGDQFDRLDNLSFSEVDASGLVHHKMHDEHWTALPTPPHLDTEKRYLSYPSTAATLNLAAVTAQCARVFRPFDAAYADRCLEAAIKAYDAALRLPDILAYDVLEGGGGAYGDRNLADEFYWAAAELFATTGEARYREDMAALPHYLAAPRGDANATNDIFWNSVQTLGSLTLLAAPDRLEAKQLERLRKAFVKGADAYLAQAAKDGYGVPFDRSYNWGSNGDMANRGIVLAAAYDITGEEKYRQGVVAIMDYLLGRNPLGQSYISGYGENPMKAPHHRFWAKAVDPSLPGPPPGALAGGPNAASAPEEVARRLHDGSCAPQTCYADETEAYSLNEVAINWNAPLFWIAAFLDEGRTSD